LEKYSEFESKFNKNNDNLITINNSMEDVTQNINNFESLSPNLTNSIYFCLKNLKDLIISFINKGKFIARYYYK